MASIASTSGQPSLEDPRGRGVTALYWTMAILSGFIVFLRFWSRRISRKTGADDWLMFACWLLLLGLTIMMTRLYSVGGFRHITDIQPQNLSYILMLIWASQPLAIVGLTCGKVAVAVTILRIRGSSASRNFRWSFYLIIALTVAVAIATIFMQMFQCNPPRRLWDPSVVEGSCLDRNVGSNFTIAASVWLTLVDVILAVTPATFILKLKLDLKKRILISFGLSLTLLTAMASIFKTVNLRALGSSPDFTWNVYNLFVWHGVEMWLFVQLGSAPLLKPLWREFFGRKDRGTVAENEELSGRIYRQQSTKNLSSNSQPSWSGASHPRNASQQIQDV